VSENNEHVRSADEMQEYLQRHQAEIDEGHRSRMAAFAAGAELAKQHSKDNLVLSQQLADSNLRQLRLTLELRNHIDQLNDIYTKLDRLCEVPQMPTEVKMVMGHEVFRLKMCIDCLKLSMADAAPQSPHPATKEGT